MNYEKIRHITENVRETLSANPKRFMHSIAVADMAMCLAVSYRADLEKAYLAGILHENAKYIPNEDQVRLCLKYGLAVSDIEKKNPYLLHAKLGAYFAYHKFDIYDEEIAGAIEWHTTGRPAMNDLEKIIYISDYLEPNRHHADNLDKLRKLAFVDLNKTTASIIADTINMLESKHRPVDETTFKAFEFYKNVLE